MGLDKLTQQMGRDWASPSHIMVPILLVQPPSYIRMQLQVQRSDLSPQFGHLFAEVFGVVSVQPIFRSVCEVWTKRSKKLSSRAKDEYNSYNFMKHALKPTR